MPMLPCCVGTASYPNWDLLRLRGKAAGLGHMAFSCPGNDLGPRQAGNSRASGSFAPHHSLYFLEAEAYRKTKDVCEKSEPSANKVGRCLLPPGSQVLPGLLCGFWEVSSSLCAHEVSTLLVSIRLPSGLLSYRSRIVLLPLPKGRWQPRPTLKQLFRGLGWYTRPKHLLLPRTWGAKHNPHIGSGEQRPPRTPKGLGYPPRPHPRCLARRPRLVGS